MGDGGLYAQPQTCLQELFLVTVAIVLVFNPGSLLLLSVIDLLYTMLLFTLLQLHSIVKLSIDLAYSQGHSDHDD